MEKLELKQWPYYVVAVEAVSFRERVQRISSQAAAFTNVVLRVSPSDVGAVTFSEMELKTLMDIVLTTLSAQKKVPEFGSLAVYAQEMTENGWGESACILLADLKNGPSDAMDWKRDLAVTSRGVVQDMVFPILNPKMFRQMRIVTEYATEQLIEEADNLKSKIYYNAARAILVMNADLGRYIVAYCDGEKASNTQLLAVIAQVLACLHDDDETLRESATAVKESLLATDVKSRELMQAVEQMFADGDPLLAEWEKWRQRCSP